MSCLVANPEWLFATLWTVAYQAPLSMGILQARILEWVDISSSRESSWCRDWTYISRVSCIGRWVLYHWATWGAFKLNLYTVKFLPENTLKYTENTHNFGSVTTVCMVIVNRNKRKYQSALSRTILEEIAAKEKTDSASHPRLPCDRNLQRLFPARWQLIHSLQHMDCYVFPCKSISSEIILIGTLMTFQQLEVVPIIGRYITIPLKKKDIIRGK